MNMIGGISSRDHLPTSSLTANVLPEDAAYHTDGHVWM